MYADVNAFRPAQERDDIRLDLLKIISVDAYQVSKIARYCLRDSSDDQFLLSLVKKHGILP